MPLQNQPFMQPMDTAGRPYPEAKAYYFVHDTTTPAAVYTNPELTVPHARPVRADAAGKFPRIFTDPAVVYRLELTTAIGTPIDQIDPIGGGFVVNSADLVNGAVTAEKLASRAVGNAKLDLMPGKRVKGNLSDVLAAPVDVTIADLYQAIDALIRPSRCGTLVYAAYSAGDNDKWLRCDGRSLARSAYPDLFGVIGTTWGSADGAHFNLPDGRSYGLVGADLLRGLDDGLAVGASHLDQIQRITGTVGGVFSDDSHSPYGGFGYINGAFAAGTPRDGYSAAGEDIATVSFDSQRVVRSGQTTHGREIAAVLMIYY